MSKRLSQTCISQLWPTAASICLAATVGGSGGMVEPLAAGRDRAGGDDDDLAPLAAERGALPGDLDHVRAVEPPRAAGEHTGAEFDDDTFVHERSLEQEGWRVRR